MLSWSYPLFYHPTTLMLLDDSTAFLQGVRLDTNPHDYAVTTFDNPHLGLEFLLKTPPMLSDDPYVMRDGPSGSTKVHIPDYRDLVCDPGRFDVLSILVVDYVMPGLNGLEICRSVKDKPFKKILLTGTADEKLAVKAFNEGLIDRFIHKDSRNFNHLFNQTLSYLSRQYFWERLSLLQGLLFRNGLGKSAMALPSFASLFESILQEGSIKEYFLADSMGSHFFLTYEGTPSYLQIMTREKLQDYCRIAQQANVDSSLIRKMEQGAYIPFSLKQGDLQEPATWRRGAAALLHPCESMGPDLLMAYVTDESYFRAGDGGWLQKIYSFREYVNKNT